MSKERLGVIIVVKMQYRFSYSREGIGFVLSIAGTAIPNRMRRRSHNSARLSDRRLLPIVAKGDAKERRGDTECRENRSFESAGNFGDTAAASTMIHRNFQNTGPLLRHQHLHLQIPAVSFLSHGQRMQQLRADRAKRRHIGEIHTITQAQ